ncbi:MAG: cobalamin biosynthesis protein [Stenomitos frigidus ULC029]
MVAANGQTIPCPSRVYWVGIGCKCGTSKRVIEQAVRAVFQAHNLSESAIVGLATINTKADEAGLIEFCRDRHLPLHCFSADQLRSIAVPNPLGAIIAFVGTPSVAEAAALLASWMGEKPSDLCVPKQIFRHLGQTGLVTVAVACSGQP